MANRANVIFNDFVEARLELLCDMTSLSRPAVFLAALAEYRKDIQVTEQKPKRKRKPRQGKTLGGGNKPKDAKEVVEFFRSKKIPEPVEPKAQLFYDHYQSVGWVLKGGNSIKEWGSCLTTWLKNNADWRPIPEADKNEINLDDFLDWASENRTPVYEKFKNAKSIEDIGQLYLDEYIENQ